MKEFDVAALGSGNIDLIFAIPALPSQGGKAVGKMLGKQVGGTVANSACAMSRLGLNVVSVSCIGDDDSGQSIIHDFKKHGVNCDFIQTISGLTANTAIIFIDDSGEKSLVYAPGSQHEWNEEKARQAIRQSRYFYTMPANLEKFQPLAEFARTADTRVVVDIEPHIASTPQRLEAILQLADIAIFNYDGFLAGCAVDPDFAALRQLQEKYHLDAVVVTLDARGAIAVKGHEEAKIASYPIKVIDTTGAGDTFNAAFVYTLIHQLPLTDALHFAAAAAAINITALGARGHLAKPPEVELFIANHS